MITVEKWQGLITNASPYAVGGGGFVKQVNVQCVRPGQAEVRPGQELNPIGSLPISSGPYVGKKLLAQKENGQLASVLIRENDSYLVSSVNAQCSSASPASIVCDRYGRAYIKQQGRGLVWVGGTHAASTMGITKAHSITCSSSSAVQYYYVDEISVSDGGSNYYAAPVVAVSGVSGLKAKMDGDSVSEISFTSSATTHTTAPSVKFSGGTASGASVKTIASGEVSFIAVDDNDAAYVIDGKLPEVVIAAATGVTEVRKAKAYVTLRPDFSYSSLTSAITARIGQVVITDPGCYQIDSAAVTSLQPIVKASVPGSVSSTRQATLTPRCNCWLDGVVSVTGGTNYTVDCPITFSADGPLKLGAGAEATAAVSNGSVTGGTVTRSGSGYDGRIHAVVDSKVAQASAVLAPIFSGKYLCGIRYIDDTPESMGGPVAGDFCDFVEVDCAEGASEIRWDLSGAAPSGERATAVELWRTSGDQAITLYRVATYTIQGGIPSTHSDSIPDFFLVDDSREGYAALPILTPEGYPNANRRGLPPENFDVMFMHQDRAWYAKDVTGAEPNTLYFSEVDEPESVPKEYQIVLQSVTPGSDHITGLFAIETSLYAAQTGHIYRVTVSGHPLANANVALAAQRGAVSQRCIGYYDGWVYLADAQGMYRFNGSEIESLSDPISNIWLNDKTSDYSLAIDSKWNFLDIDTKRKVVRFYCSILSSSQDPGLPTAYSWLQYYGNGIKYPTACVCYSIVTKALWIEMFPMEFGCALPGIGFGARSNDVAGISKEWIGGVDYIVGSNVWPAVPVRFQMKTGNFGLSDEAKRSVRVYYTPTIDDQFLEIGLCYNGSSEPRKSVVDYAGAMGFVSKEGNWRHFINLGREGNVGFGELSLSGRMDDKSGSGDRHLAIQVEGQVSVGSSINRIILHKLEIQGVE